MAAEEANRVCVIDYFTESDGYTAARLLSELTGASGDSGEGLTGEGVRWSVSNRYYQTDIWLEVRGHPGTNKGVWQAIITLCDLSNSVSLKKAFSVWEGLNPEATPPVNLLVGVVDGCELGEGVRGKVVQWCLGRGVELVEWHINPPTKPQNEEEDDFPESVGVVRVCEALQAHMWPVMSLTGSRERNVCNGEREGERECVANGDVDRDNNSGEDDATNSSSSSAAVVGSGASNSTPSSDCRERDVSSVPQPSERDVDSSPREARFDNLTGGASPMEELQQGMAEGEVEDFDTLFSKFAEMKGHAQSLPHEERKAYAEKVAMSFWKAIGGDEEEITSDSDSEKIVEK